MSLELIDLEATAFAGLTDGYDGACAVIDAVQQAILDGVLTKGEAVAKLDPAFNRYVSLQPYNRDAEGEAEMRRFIASLRRPVDEVVAEGRAALGIK